MIKFKNILNELEIQPHLLPIPEGWSEYDISGYELDKEEGKLLKAYSAPMEGWDTEHEDIIQIFKTPQGKFKVYVYIAFGDGGDAQIFDTFKKAYDKALEIMNGLKKDWDDYDDDDEELDELERPKNIYNPGHSPEEEEEKYFKQGFKTSKPSYSDDETGKITSDVTYLPKFKQIRREIMKFKKEFQSLEYASDQEISQLSKNISKTISRLNDMIFTLDKKIQLYKELK